MRESRHGYRNPRRAMLVAGTLLALAPTTVATPPDLYRLPDLDALQRTFETLATRVRPSVVSIRTYRYVGLPAGGADRQLASMPHSFGSGVVIQSDGLILTNQHVLDSADLVKVVLFNRNEHEADVVQQDIRSDLAVLRIEAKPLRAVTFGDAGEVAVGHWCFAVGNPFGIAYADGNPAVTFGNIAALGRSLTSELDDTDTRYYGDLIQTSTPINPGNSGGPLFDLDGRMIGIVTAIVSHTGITEGAGFAIPVRKRTRDIIHALAAGKPWRYGYLGVSVVDGTTPIGARGQSASRRGARIEALSNDEAPAAKADLRPNDVIIEFAGVPIEGSDALIRVVGMTPVGAQAKVRYIRNGQRRETVVTLAERMLPHRTVRASGESHIPTRWWNGALLAEMNDATLRLHRLTRLQAGLVVAKVQRHSASQRAGLKADDIILRVNGTRVRDLADFAKTQSGDAKRFQFDLLGGRSVRVRL